MIVSPEFEELRRLAIAVYRPMGLTEAAPLIVLSHGGATGKTDPLKSMDKWAPAFATAGYIAVAIAHPGRRRALRRNRVHINRYSMLDQDRLGPAA